MYSISSILGQNYQVWDDKRCSCRVRPEDRLRKLLPGDWGYIPVAASKVWLIMNGSWYTISEMNIGETGRIDLVASAGVSSPWFDGHFPGEPILPGIAQIFMAWDAIRRSKGPDCIPPIKEVKRLRFRQIIRPDEPIQVSIEPDRNKKGHYAFKISVRGELACNGSITTGETEHPCTD